jgi:hypothetical protein
MNNNNNNINNKRVSFSPKGDSIKRILVWEFAMRNARIGYWEQLARDRVRFQDTIKNINNILKPILEIEHRFRIFKTRFTSNEPGNNDV